MKKIVSILSAVVLLSFSAFSLEWGGVFKTDLSFSVNDFSDFKSTSTLSHSDGIYLWLTTPLNDTATTYLTGEVMYKFKLSLAGMENPAVSNIFDLDLLKLVSDFDIGKGSLSLNLGRFMIADSTNGIFSQVLDGASVRFSLPSFIVSAFAGYTGLLNESNVAMLDGTGALLSSSDFYKTGASYIPIGVTAEFNSLGGNQSLNTQLMSIIDVTGANLSRFYLNLVLSGPIANSFYYSCATSIGSVGFTGLMNFTDAQVFWFASSALALSAGAEYASGNHAIFRSFVGFTTRTPYQSAAAPETTGLLMPKLAVSLTDGVFYALVSGKFVMDFSGNVPSPKGVDFGVSFTYNIFTDLQVGLNLVTFFDFADSSNSNYGATLSAAFSF